MALDGSLYRGVWHGTPVSSHLHIFIFFILSDVIDLDVMVNAHCEFDAAVPREISISEATTALPSSNRPLTDKAVAIHIQV